MNTKTITPAEIEGMKISALPTRPTAPGYFGGKGYTARDIKNAFDKLPLFIIERFNALIDDITGDSGGSIAEDVKTGIKDSHTLSALFADITDGTLSTYLTVAEKPLLEQILDLKSKLNTIAKHIGITL